MDGVDGGPLVLQDWNGKIGSAEGLDSKSARYFSSAPGLTVEANIARMQRHIYHRISYWLHRKTVDRLGWKQGVSNLIVGGRYG